MKEKLISNFEEDLSDNKSCEVKNLRIDTSSTRISSNMYPVMSETDKTIYFVSGDESTLSFDVGISFKGKRLRHLDVKDLSDIIHSYLEENLPDFHDKVNCLILKTDSVRKGERFVLDYERLKAIFPKLVSIYCKNEIEIINASSGVSILDPFELGEISFDLARDGDIENANYFVRKLWELDSKWARFFREVARDYYRKPEEQPKVDSAVHTWTGMDHLSHIYLLGWYHRGDDLSDEKDKVYAEKYRDFNKALDLLAVRFRNYSLKEIAEKLYWDIEHIKNDAYPEYHCFDKILSETERLFPGVQNEMLKNGWITEDLGDIYITRTCNMCGRSFNFWDNHENFCLDRSVGFGSKYDLHRIRLDLCCRCFDKIIDQILPQCKHNPIVFKEEV